MLGARSSLLISDGAPESQKWLSGMQKPQTQLEARQVAVSSGK